MSDATCARPTLATAGIHQRSIVVDDPLLGPITRNYTIAIPQYPGSVSGLPLLLVFHGQSGSAEGIRKGHTFDRLANTSHVPWIVVYPNGMADGKSSGWNCGTAADDSTCLVNTTGASCHDSCVRLGRCGRCNWSTCYDECAAADRTRRTPSQPQSQTTDRVPSTCARVPSNGPVCTSSSDC